jgi:hypothetical protein
MSVEILKLLVRKLLATSSVSLTEMQRELMMELISLKVQFCVIYYSILQ